MCQLVVITNHLIVMITPTCKLLVYQKFISTKKKAKICVF